MRFSELWLREWVDPKCSTEALCEALTMAGLEVDACQATATPFTEVVVGKVLSKQKHPDADNLSVCEIDVGLAKPKTIVCGAANIAQHMKVAVAIVGAHLPGMHAQGETLGVVQLKGIISEGMVCSSTELGLGESEGILPLHPDAPVGASVWDYLALNDTEIEVDLTPNRGDCLSILGIARDVGAFTKTKVEPFSVPNIKPEVDETRTITLEAHQHCPKYVGRVIKGVDAHRPTPDWMVEKLRRSGLRSINVVVDVMNFVMLEMGQPMHAFDLDKVHGNIIVRMAKPNESIKLLDGQEITLSDDTLVIADSKQALAMAGVMGGEDSAVLTDTQNVFLESAFFTPRLIAGCARKHNLFTDSAFRFERGVDYQNQALAIERATLLIITLCGGQPGPVIEKISPQELPKARTVLLSLDRVHRLLGLAIPKDVVEDVLTRLGCELEAVSPGTSEVAHSSPSWRVKVPSYRFDFTIEEDLIEDICRIVGYNTIPNTLPDAPLVAPTTDVLTKLTQRFKHAMVDLGYSEAITYSFVDPKLQKQVEPEIEALALLNPISSDLSEMRTSLWSGLIGALKFNQNRQVEDIRLFEQGLRFRMHEGKLTQEEAFAGICAGHEQAIHWQQKPRKVDFYDVKGHVESLWRLTGRPVEALKWQPLEHPSLHPGQSASVLYHGVQVAIVGALHPALLQSLSLSGPVFVFEWSLNTMPECEPVNFVRPSKYPEIHRDLSFTVLESQAVGDIVDFVKNNVGELLQQVTIFDIYSGKGIDSGHKSVALGISLQHASRTLVESEVESLMQTLVHDLNVNFGAKLRD